MTPQPIKGLPLWAGVMGLTLLGSFAALAAAWWGFYALAVAIAVLASAAGAGIVRQWTGTGFLRLRSGLTRARENDLDLQLSGFNRQPRELQGLAGVFNGMIRNLQALRLDQEETIHRLRETIHTKKQDLHTLFAVSHAMTSILNLETLLGQILEILIPVIGGKSGIIWLVDESSISHCREIQSCRDETCPAFHNQSPRCWAIPDTRCRTAGHSPSPSEGSLEAKLAGCLTCPVLRNVRLSMRVAVGLEPGAMPVALSFGDTLCQQVVQQKPPVMVLHLFPPEGEMGGCFRQATWLSEDRPLEKPQLVQGATCFPEPVTKATTKIGMALVTRNQLLGIMCLGLDRIHFFSQDEVTLLSNIAGLAAVAIENAELFTLAEKRSQQVTVLLHEAHHRIKNNLQAIASLWAMQLSDVQDSETRDLIAENLSRIRSIALVHQLLTEEEVRSVNLAEMGGKVLDVAIQASSLGGQRVAYHIQGESTVIPSQKATSIALILNELAVNSIKHGFRGRARGTLRLRLSHSDHQIHLELTDDGGGVKPGFDLKTEAHLGLQIVTNLVREDLDGTFRLASDAHGTSAHIQFPVMT